MRGMGGREDRVKVRVDICSWEIVQVMVKCVQFTSKEVIGGLMAIYDLKKILFIGTKKARDRKSGNRKLINFLDK